MTPEELERMSYLCNRIQEENEAEAFDKLVAELNSHIEAKHGRVGTERENQNPTDCVD
jgi:hypothetical protein